MRQKKISKEEYIRLYCTEKRIRKRMVLYVSEDIHQKIKRITGFFRDHYITTASLVDAILNHHIEAHRELFEGLDKEERENFERSLKSFNKRTPEEEDEVNQ